MDEGGDEEYRQSHGFRSAEPPSRKAAAKELLARRRARDSLMGFTRYTNPRYQVAWHNERIAYRLDQVMRGEIRRLLIVAPPRHGKTELASRRFPAYYLGKHPDHDIISCSYGQDLSLDFSRDVRLIVKEREYQNVFPGVMMAPDSQAANRWHVASRDPVTGKMRYGGYVAAGIGTAITGRGAHLLNIDDPVKGRKEAESEGERRSAWEWYRSVAYTRLMPGAAIVLTLTRWHLEDLAGMILTNAEEEDHEKWTIEHLPALNEQNEALWPERYPKEVLDQIRATLGPYDWNALYMGNPQPLGGSFFTEDDLLVDGQPITPPKRATVVYAIIDTAMKTGQTHDGLGVAFWAKYHYVSWIPTQAPPKPWLCLLDWDYLQIEGGSLERWLPSVFAKLEAYTHELETLAGSRGAYIEDKVSGTVLLQQAANHGWPATAIPSGLTAMGKSERALDAHPATRAGLVKVSRQAWERVVTFKGQTRNHMRSQVLAFRPGSQETAADDLLDDFTYGIALGLGNREGF